MTPTELRQRIQACLSASLSMSQAEGEDSDDDLKDALFALWSAMESILQGDLETACDEIAEAEAILFDVEEGEDPG